VRSSADRRLILVLLAAALLGVRTAESQQAVEGPPIDSVVVVGNRRVSTEQILRTAGLAVGQPANFRIIQRAILALFQTGQFDDVQVEQGGDPDRLVLIFRVRERPILRRWEIRGASQVPPSQVRSRVSLIEGRPVDRALVEQSRSAIDSLYARRGFFATQVRVDEHPEGEDGLRLVFAISEGQRLAVSQVVIEGNTVFPDREVVQAMGSRPEGFWWFQSGEFREERLDEDLRERLPAWYASRGHIDFQVLRDSLIADTVPGKAILLLEVEEGDRYLVGRVQIEGNRRYSTDEILSFLPFGNRQTAARGEPLAVPFDRVAWEEATERLRELYANTGYIYARVEPELLRRTGPDGQSYADLRWVIQEGSPAIVNRILIRGNEVTHERVIREQIVMVPGQVFSRDAFIRSYQNISNLNFFEQPLPQPEVRPAENGVDVDVIFTVVERRTGNVQFGASLGQGTGVGGFIGLEEPNLLGQGKRGRLQWQFGRNINDFTLSYTDPAIRESRISGTITLYNSRQRFTVGDLGRRHQRGGSLQLGFPLFGARYTRWYASYSYQRIGWTEGSEDLRARFRCARCVRSTLGTSVVRDTRIGLPFAIGGSSVTISAETNGGVLGGTGNFEKFDLEGRWYAPLATVGGEGRLGAGIQLVLGLTAKSGFVLGDPGPFFTELYTMGGVQFGLPLRGYEEFSITPNGFDPRAGATSAGEGAFGQSYASFTVETGARVSQALYVNLFFDAGNVYRSARQYNPLRLFRGTGIGVAVLSPLGPLGVDIGYGLDRRDLQGRPDPGWKVHFRVGTFF
jgi:outer membrane protein insertion porin family